MQSPRPASTCVIVVLGLTACASEPYKEPVATFAQAVTKSTEALAALESQLANAHSEVNMARALSPKNRVAPKDCDHDTARVKDCVLLLQETDEDGKDVGSPSNLQPDAPLAEIRILLDGIKSYADNLAAVLNADTTEKVRNSVNKALGSLERLTHNSKVRKEINQRRTPVKDFATPLANAVNWVVGKYVESIKIDAIRHATFEADPIVQATTRAMMAAEQQGERIMHAVLVNSLRNANDAWVKTPSESNLSKLMSEVRALQHFRSQARPSLFKAMADAHRSLKNRLANSQDLTWTTTMAKVEQFNAEADSLLQIIDSFSELTKPGLRKRLN